LSPDVVGINFLIAFGGTALAGVLSGYALKKAFIAFQAVFAKVKYDWLNFFKIVSSLLHVINKVRIY